MNNSYCRDYVLGLTSEIKMDELSHHGILGMSWGKRFGPPYPLGGVDKTVSRAEAKRKKEAERRIAKLQKARKKAAKMKAKAAKKEAKRIEEEEERMRKKQELIDDGNYQKILKNSKLFSNDELQYFKEQHDMRMKERFAQLLDGAMKVAILTKSISDIASNISNFQKVARDNELNQLTLKDKKLDMAKKAQAMVDEHKKSQKALEVSDAAIKKSDAERGKVEEETRKAAWETKKAEAEAKKSAYDTTEKYISLGKPIREDRLDAIIKNTEIAKAADNFNDYLASRAPKVELSTPISDIPSDYTAAWIGAGGSRLSDPNKSSVYRSSVGADNWKSQSGDVGSGTVFGTYSYTVPKKKQRQKSAATTATPAASKKQNTTSAVENWPKENVSSAPVKEYEQPYTPKHEKPTSAFEDWAKSSVSTASIKDYYTPKHEKSAGDKLGDLIKKFGNIIL